MNGAAEAYEQRPLRSRAAQALGLLSLHRRRASLLALGFLIAAVIRLGFTPWALLSIIPALVIAVLIFSRAPRLREFAESLGLGAILMSLTPAPDIGLLVLIPAGAYLGHLLLYGRWWDWTPLRVCVTSTRRARVPVPIEELWVALVPGEGTPDEYWTGTLIDFEVDPDDPMTRYLRHDRSAELPIEATVTFVEWVWQSSCRYIVEEVSEGPAGDAEITLSFDAIGDEDTVVESIFVQSGLTPRLALRRWLENRVGDEWDMVPARVKRSRAWSFHASNAVPAT